MINYEFIGNLVENLAWPFTVLVMFIALRSPIKSALSRIASLKHGDTEVTFSDISKKIITQEPPPDEKKRLARQQTVYQNVFGNNSYIRLYSNGILVQRFKCLVLPGETQRQLIFPTAFPNEPLSIQFIGDITARIKEINQCNFTFECEPEINERKIEVVVSGL